jgi:hypothetical protein
MKRIFKYELIVADHSKLCLPIGARILSVQVQRGTVCLWAIVDEYQKELCFVDIYMYGTGQHVSDADLAGKRFRDSLNTQTILKLLFGNRHFEYFLSNIAAAY